MANFIKTNYITGHDAAFGIRSLDFEALDKTAVPQTENDTIDRLLKVYIGVRGALALVAHSGLFPPTWRRAMQIFIDSLDALATLRGFKAGRDL